MIIERFKRKVAKQELSSSEYTGRNKYEDCDQLKEKIRKFLQRKTGTEQKMVPRILHISFVEGKIY